MEHYDNVEFKRVKKTRSDFGNIKLRNRLNRIIRGHRSPAFRTMQGFVITMFYTIIRQRILIVTWLRGACIYKE